MFYPLNLRTEITTRCYKMSNQYKHEERPWTDEDFLYDEYVEKGLSTYKVAEKVGCSYQTINNWLEEFDIQKEKPNDKKPPSYGNSVNGYCVWQHQIGEEHHSVYVHRLLAVAEFGMEEVKDAVVHHKNGFKWDNRADNIEVMDPSQHTQHHLPDMLSEREDIDDKSVRPSEMVDGFHEEMLAE